LPDGAFPLAAYAGLRMLFDGDMRYLSAVRQVVLREDVDPCEGSCSNCPHAPFIHSDGGRRTCLYSGCECPGYAGEREPAPATLEPANDEEPFFPPGLVGVIGNTFLVRARSSASNGRR
jgi:hypothetical protein